MTLSVVIASKTNDICSVPTNNLNDCIKKKHFQLWKNQCIENV